MKKKVRIYKAPDGKGKFVNKTAKFLHKAQQGGQQDQQAQIAQYVYKTLDDAEPFEFDTVKESLITELAAAKIPIEQAEDMVENIATNLQAQTAEAEQLAGDVYDQGQEDLKAQEEAEAAAEEERQAGLADDYGYYDDTAAQGEDDEDEEDYDDEEEASYMQAGGDIIPNDNPVSFTGYNPDQYTIDKGQSFSHGGMTKRKYVGQVMKLLKKAQEGQEAKDEKGGFDPKDTADNKKKNLNKGFVNALANTAKEAKMKEQAEAMWEQQQQMMQQQASQYPMQQQQFAQDGIETGWQKPKSYEDYKPKTGWSRGSMTDAEKEYEKEWLENYEYPRHGHPGLKVSDVEKGNYPGGYRSAETNAENENEYNRRNQARQGNIYNPRQIQRMMPRGFGRGQMRSFAGMVPPGGFFPMGMNIMTYPMMMPEQKPIHVQGTIPGMKLDVRKSHWLTGRPSQYSIEFGGDGAIPGFNMMPGMGYGYKSTQRRTIEGVSKLVNKAADPGKSNKVELNNNPDPEKKNSADAAVADQSNVVKDKEGNPITSDASNMMWNSSGTNMPTAENSEAKSSSTTPDNPNKEVIGDNSKLPPKSEVKKVNTATKSKQPGQNKPVNNNTITNKNKIVNTPSKKNDYSNVTEKSSAPAKPAVPEFDFRTMVPDWMKQAIMNNQSKSASNKLQEQYDAYNGRGWSGGGGNWQTGGFIDSSNPDLYKFVYGGDDIITQQDANYSDSKNTGSPFFAYGGHIKYQDKGEVKEDDYDKYLREKAEQEALDEYNAFMNRGEGDKNKMVKYKPNVNDAIYNKILGQSRKKYNIADPNEKPKVEEKKAEPKQEQKESTYQGTTYNPYSGYGGGYRPNAFGRYFPANTINRLGTWTQQQGMPYDPRTGAAYFGGFGPGTQLSKIDVRKSGWLSGRPKKYTMYFNNAEMDPTKPEFSINTGTDSKGEPGTTARGWGEGELKGWKNKLRAKRHDKWMDEIDNQKAIDKQIDEDVANEAIEDNSDAPTRGVSQVPTSVSEMGLPDKLGVSENKGEQQYNTLYPKGTKSTTGIDSIYEPEDMGPNSYNAPASVNQEYNTLYPEGTKSVTGIDSVYEPEESQPNSYQEPIVNEDGEEVDEDGNVIDAGDQFAPQQNMYQNGVPGFGEDMMGVPMMNGAISPWSLPDGFTPNTGLELGNGSGAPPFAENIFPPTDVDDPAAGFGWHSNMTLQEGMAKKKAERDAAIAKQKADQEKATKIAKQQRLQQQDAKAQVLTKQLQSKSKINQVLKSPYASGENFESFVESPRSGQYYTEMKNYARSQGIDPEHNVKGFEALVKKEGWDKFYNAYMKDLNSLGKNRKSNYSVDNKTRNELAESAKYRNRQFGGDSNLGRFVYGDEVTQTSTGKDSPVVYTNNPALEGIRDVDIVGPNTQGITNLQPSTFWSDQQSFNKPTMDFQTGCTEEEKKDPKSRCYDAEKYGMKVQEDALGSARETTQKKYAPKAGQFAIDFKNKNTYAVDAQGTVLSANALGKGIFGALDRRSSNKLNKNFYDAFTSDNLYASDPSRDRGDYETNSGLYRPNEQGQIWNSRSKQLGGYMQDGGFVEGDVVDMTPEELEEFIANGGEVEIIS